MRIFLFAACALMWVVPTTASAQGTVVAVSSSGQAHFAKLQPLVGTWNCMATGGGKPYTAVVKVEGAWVVWREKTAEPATEYIGWSDSLNSYVVAEIESSGGLQVSTTKDNDPLNASWQPQFPPQSRSSSFSTSFSAGVFKLIATYVGQNGQPRVGRLICRKM